MTVEEIRKYVGYYTTAALNAMKAGFDGVEIHAANGSPHLCGKYFTILTITRLPPRPVHSKRLQ
jgi:2,4-dienoyl-CoA reductase-like NADH-dependent reductase (Old Yellow Enzyme family)